MIFFFVSVLAVIGSLNFKMMVCGNRTCFISIYVISFGLFDPAL